MSDDSKNQPGAISIGGSVSGNGIAIGHGASASNVQSNAPSDDESAKLQALFAQLRQTLEQAPPDAQAKAWLIKGTVTQVEEAVKSGDPEVVNLSLEGLKRAAESIKGVMPTVLTIAAQIAAHVAGFGR